MMEKKRNMKPERVKKMMTVTWKIEKLSLSQKSERQQKYKETNDGEIQQERKGNA